MVKNAATKLPGLHKELGPESQWIATSWILGILGSASTNQEKKILKSMGYLDTATSFPLFSRYGHVQLERPGAVGKRHGCVPPNSSIQLWPTVLGTETNDDARLGTSTTVCSS